MLETTETVKLWNGETWAKFQWVDKTLALKEIDAFVENGYKNRMTTEIWVQHFTLKKP